VKLNRKTAISFILVTLFLLRMNFFGWNAYFSFPPSSAEIKSSFLNLISKANTSIDLAIYNLTDKDIVNVLREKASNGVKVRIVMEGKNYVKNIDTLSDLNVVADPVEGGLMHEKLAIVDGEYVWVSSSNLTPSSFYNDLNKTSGQVVKLDQFYLHTIYNQS